MTKENIIDIIYFVMRTGRKPVGSLTARSSGKETTPACLNKVSMWTAWNRRFPFSAASMKILS